MTLSEIQSAVGRRCGLLDGSGNFVDGMVSADDITALANNRWIELHIKYSDKFPDGIALEIPKDLVEDTSDYEITEVGTTEYLITYVGIKYASTDTYYTRVRRSRYNSLFGSSTDTSSFTKTIPYYIEVPSRQDAAGGSSQQGILKAIRLFPTPDADVTEGLLIKGVEMPVKMSLATDTPYTLPAAAHPLIADFVVADVWEIKRDWANSNEALNRALLNDKNFFSNYQPTTADKAVYFNPGRTFDPYSGR